ncbi:hypothetical protein N0V88_007117 [Collariella sp. IMI 366227]|nr:hypothetical protein N0V88_007117 [Collariella sp. IMI 366227]
MNDTREDALREQVTASVLGRGGADGMKRPELSRNTFGYDDRRPTPRVSSLVPRVSIDRRRHGYLRGILEPADYGRDLIDDDIDADSILSDDRSAAWRFSEQQRQKRETRTAMPGRTPPSPRVAPSSPRIPPPLPRTAPPPSWAIPSSPRFATPLTFPPPEMACRLSRPPCELPELVPDHDDTSGIGSPLASGPTTPSFMADIFRPLTEFSSPNLELGAFLKFNPAPELDLYRGMRRMSMTPSISAPDGLGMIQEEEDDVNADGVSVMTPTEVSFGGDGDSGSTRFERHGYLAAGVRYHNQSVSSLGSGSGSSGEWRPGHAPRKSSSTIMGRIRSRPQFGDEPECLEKRSLTPVQLLAPPRPLFDEDQLTLAGTRPSTSASSNAPSQIGRIDGGGTPLRFFHRMPWVGDAEGKKHGAVFGVDLKESVREAPMKIRISHKGRSTSYRSFPLSVYKCCEFIRRAAGAIEPLPRVETGLDFWTEAFNRLPTDSRNLTKHLLTLFAEVLLAAEGRLRMGREAVGVGAGEADVSSGAWGWAFSGGGGKGQQKGRAGRKNVHATLALAFLIKKRGM